MSDPRFPEFSVVVPFYNEEGILPSYLPEIAAAMADTGASWEAIFINDGSRDNTGQLLEDLTRLWENCRVIHHVRNSGQAAALWTGFAQVRGTWIITLDGDGQNVPQDIPRLIAARGRSDMVVGIRASRRDTYLRRAMSRVANKVRRKALADGMSDSGCALKVFRREIIGSFLPMRSLYSFMPAFSANAGFRLAEIPVTHRERTTGKSNYGFLSFAWRPLVDMLALWWISHRRIQGAISLVPPIVPIENAFPDRALGPSAPRFAQPFTTTQYTASPSRAEKASTAKPA